MRNPQHGTGYSYNEGCRCDDCRAANARRTAVQRRERNRKMRVGLASPPHGHASTYLNYDYRCEPCKQAHSVALAKRRAKKQAAS